MVEVIVLTKVMYPSRYRTNVFFAIWISEASPNMAFDGNVSRKLRNRRDWRMFEFNNLRTDWEVKVIVCRDGRTIIEEF